MQRSTYLTAIAALGMTVIAGASAVAVTFDQGLTAGSTPAAATQYVDQFGNPVDPPGTTSDATATAPTSSSTASRDHATTTRVDDDEHEEED
jgi:hypothetical protein